MQITNSLPHAIQMLIEWRNQFNDEETANRISLKISRAEISRLIDGVPSWFGVLDSDLLFHEMTDLQKEVLHVLKLSLPGPATLRAEAVDRIKARILERRRLRMAGSRTNN